MSVALSLLFLGIALLLTFQPGRPSRGYAPSSDRDESQVYATSGRFQSHDLSDRIRRRYKDLARLIALDRQSFHILEMSPMPAHALYMRDIRLTNKKTAPGETIDEGAGWTATVKTQTNEDAENVPSQTEEIDVRSMWTQHPSESEHTACGSGNSAEDKQLPGQ